MEGRTDMVLGMKMLRLGRKDIFYGNEFLIECNVPLFFYKGLYFILDGRLGFGARI